MFARQVAYSLSYVRTKMKAVTSGKKTHPAIKRVCECLQKLDTEELQQDRLSSLRKRVHSPDRSTRSAGNLQDGSCIARNLDRQQQQLQGCPACTCACRGDRTRRGGFRIVGLEGHHVAVLLQGFLQVHHSDDGRTSKRHPVFKGPDGFLKTKVFGKLKELDVPNLFMQTFENPAAHGGISKIMKRPAAKKTAKKAPASAGSASADGKAEEPEEPELSTPPPKQLATPKSTSSPNPSPKSAATPQEDGSPNRDSLLCASVHYIMASDRTYITGKFGKTKALLIEIHSRKSDKHRDLCKELFKEAERLQSSMPWGELRELMRNRRDEVLQRQAE